VCDVISAPLVSEDKVYATTFGGTSDGLLICLKTGSADADGCYARGGNGEHNKNK
jgi:hypothetical protein